jgi:phosphate uptake regulator/aminoglycoside phosphotransferase (APT) family kinase protein
MASVLLQDLIRDVLKMARLVQSQLVSAMTAFFQRDVEAAKKVMDKDDQVDNLLGFVEERCFRHVPEDEVQRELETRKRRGILRVVVNLEKLGDFAVNIAEQTVHIARFERTAAPIDLASPARMALAAFDEVINAFTEASVEKVKAACRYEPELDRHYRVALTETLRRLRERGGDPAYLITNLFMAKFLERIGDSILNIGESTLLALTGERLKLHQYLHLEEMVGATTAGEAVDLQPIWGGISGARVWQVRVGNQEPLIWKEGEEGKIEEEIREIEEWNRLVPGLVPELRARYQHDGRESYLRQYVEGRLLRDIYLERPWDEKIQATRRLIETLSDVWRITARPDPPAVDYVRQIRSRLPDLYTTHPDLEELGREGLTAAGICHRSLPQLLDLVAAAEPRLAPPCSVRIHGDFNTNNVFYDPERDAVHFIDVHRSGLGDYALDVGVFVVSSLRNPVQDAAGMAEIERLNRQLVDFAEEFARQHGDTALAVRLELSIARSLITSARLVTDPEFARNLYVRGVSRLERVAAHVS